MPWNILKRAFAQVLFRAFSALALIYVSMALSKCRRADMREILYRGKSIKTGKWEVGQLTSFYEYLAQIRPLTFMVEHRVHPETVGQYTGLKDRDGKRIFEGDVVKMDSSPYRDMPVIGKIIWVHGGLWYEYIIPIGNPTRKRTAISGLAIFSQVPQEVIGNIHDDLELLKGVTE
jgi:hypothetical protein